jgi:hypothetical protein
MLMQNTAPESMVSSKNYELNGQNDVHISVDSRPWAYHKIMLDISGRIDEGYNFEALVFVGEGQAVRGNCKDGYDIAIKLPTAHGNLRLSIENNGNDLVGRGRVSVTPGPVIDINDVFLGDLTGTASASCFLQIPQPPFTISDVLVLIPRQAPTTHSVKHTSLKKPFKPQPTVRTGDSSTARGSSWKDTS